MHEGHRSRLVSKLKDGSTIYEHELLEILLFNGCPRRDMNGTAHLLIAEFKNLYGVLGAPADKLENVRGVGRNIAEYLSCLGKSLEFCNDCTCFAEIKSSADFREFIVGNPAKGSDSLEIYILDKDGRVRRICAFESEGGSAHVSSADKLKNISVYRAYGIFVAYKRTNGDASPTAADDAEVKDFIKVCSLCGVRLYDYCITSPDGSFFSYFVSDRLSCERSQITEI